uniref:Uncharacterized protein n=1 Tax=Rhizophora mucronata TaxID=61149 RepID=A0A2P2ITL1_RHIMU
MASFLIKHMQVFIHQFKYNRFMLGRANFCDFRPMIMTHLKRT